MSKNETEKSLSGETILGKTVGVFVNNVDDELRKKSKGNYSTLIKIMF